VTSIIMDFARWVSLKKPYPNQRSTVNVIGGGIFGFFG